MTTRRPWSGHWSGWVLLLVSLWGGAQLLRGATAHREATLAETLLWGALAALFFSARALFEDSRVRGKFLNLSLRLAGAIAILSLVQFFTSGGRIYWWIPTEAEAVLGPFRNRNHYASWMLLFFPLAAMQALERHVFAGLTAAAIAVTVVAGGSRAGIALLTGEAVILLILLRPAAAPALALVPWRGYGHRDELYLSTLEMIRQRPLMGHGLGAYETAYPAYARFDNGLIVDHAHCDWLEWAAEVGMIPATLFAAVAVWSLRAALRHPWALGVPAVFAHGLVDYPLHKAPIAAWTAVLLAALAAADRTTAPSGRSSGVL